MRGATTRRVGEKAGPGVCVRRTVTQTPTCHRARRCEQVEGIGVKFPSRVFFGTCRGRWGVKIEKALAPHRLKRVRRGAAGAECGHPRAASGGVVHLNTRISASPRTWRHSNPLPSTTTFLS